ncbi:MAG: hypothetical protein E2590_17290 [Chryseobacterium sp.]|nr:hypothetical protein [Chryseobacterium sp.]
MIFILKLLHTLFFIITDYFIYTKYNGKTKIKSVYYIVLCLFLILLFILNSVFEGISNKLLVVLLFFSLAIIILNFIKGFINMENNDILRNNEKLEKNYRGIKSVIFEKFIPIIILIYQLLLIWMPAIFEKMSQK